MDAPPASPLPAAPLPTAPCPAGRLRLRLYARDRAVLLKGPGRLIVTPNLDHLRLLERSAAFRRAYAQADVALNDSRFLDRLALGGRAVCWPGSELAPELLAAQPDGARIAVVGGDAAVAAFLSCAFPRLGFTHLSPSMGYIRRRSERRALAARVMAADPACVFVCTGAPQSELFAAQLKRRGCGATLLCCGSAFRFLAGVERRAPSPMRTLGAEWLWRFVREPRTRNRYLADAAFLLTRLAAFLKLRTGGSAEFGAFSVTAGRPQSMRRTGAGATTADVSMGAAAGP